MVVKYVHLSTEDAPPNLAKQPYKMVVVAETAVSNEWREQIAEWIYEVGSRYVVAWGEACEEWHDSVDFANLEAFNYGAIPDKDHVMTTWHSDEPLSEAFWFAGFCAEHPDVELSDTVILHIAEQGREDAILQAYQAAQKSNNNYL